ncbi:helix-turn-helix domain-containing protein [Cellulomonas marina]|uniref:Cupin domain-containing protein n=1 Tax=Cellulomonas marina TaxID=988821 RepID=A0A1I0Y502_9CELL|nr:XRE family transcriptional regulator [Cellulomonas marina]SFB08485.1 Cupin domain-containing protein [Cellulomonas marina]
MAEPDDTQLEIAALGAALKIERRRQGLSVKTVSERSGVSFGLISELERGKGNPSFTSLHRLARALQVTLPQLLSRLGGDEAVVRADERYTLPEVPGTPAPPVRELLSPRMQSNLQLIRSTLPVGFTNEGRPFRHLGTESVLVEQGRLRVVHGEREVELGPGDAMTYGCSTPHWWANAHEDVTVVLGSVTPLES